MRVRGSMSSARKRGRRQAAELIADSRQQRAECRQQTTDSKEQSAGSRQQTGNSKAVELMAKIAIQ
jgi:hypothetical protein